MAANIAATRQGRGGSGECSGRNLREAAKGRCSRLYAASQLPGHQERTDHPFPIMDDNNFAIVPPPLPTRTPPVLPRGSPPPEIRQATAPCPYCRGVIESGVQKCRHCGEFLIPSHQSDGMAGCLGFLLGPVGLWYKGQWAAGFAWIFMTIIVAVTGVGLLLVPFFWIGMGVHAIAAKPKR